MMGKIATSMGLMGLAQGITKAVEEERIERQTARMQQAERDWQVFLQDRAASNAEATAERAHQRDIELLGAKAALEPPKDTRTPLQKNIEAAGLTPGTPEYQRAILEGVNKPATSVNVSMPGSDDRLGRLATPEEVAEMKQRFGVDLPPGVGLQMTKDGWKPIQGSGPNKDEQKAAAAQAAKEPAVQSANMLLDQFGGMLDEGLDTGPIAGSQLGGVPLGRAVDYDRKTTADAVVKQISPMLRAIFRIPGEGALSDSEQKQYGLMMPSVEYPEQTNRVLITNLRAMLSNAVPSQQAPQPTQDDEDALVRKYLPGG